MHSSVAFTWLCFGVLVGVAFGAFADLPHAVVTFSVGALVLVFVGYVPVRKAGWVLLGLGVGLLRFVLYEPTFPPEHLVHAHDQYGFTFTAEVVEEPDVRSSSQRLTVRALPPREGKALVVTQKYPRFAYGDQVSVTCRLQTPEPIEDFRYDLYLARFGIHSLCYRPSIEKIGEGGSAFLSALYGAKTHFISRLNQVLPEPHASFAAGLLVGAKKGMPEDVLQQFNATGTTHIVALSGYNITIIGVLVLRFGILIGFRRQQAFWLTIVLIVLFVVLTGASPSITRAGVMGILVLIAQQLGRLSRIGISLLASAAVMVLVNPLILLHDAGFQLSFLSTIGLVYLAPHLKQFFLWIPTRGAIRESFVSTLSAITLTAPLILFQFERFSLVAPITNVLVLFAIPWAMGLGFILGLLALIALPVAQLSVWIAYVPLEYVLKLIDWFSRVPFANVDVPKMPTVVLVGLYGLMGVVLIQMQRKQFREIRNTKSETISNIQNTND